MPSNEADTPDRPNNKKAGPILTKSEFNKRFTEAQMPQTKDAEPGRELEARFLCNFPLAWQMPDKTDECRLENFTCESPVSLEDGELEVRLFCSLPLA